MTENKKNIWIIGASSGIGKALAIELGKRGHSLALSARRADPLSDIVVTLPKANHLVIPLDVADQKTIEKGLEDIQSQWQKIDSVIFMAGLYTPMALAEIDIQKTQQIIDINLMGAYRVLNVILPILKKHGHGQIALCASVSGYRGLPNAQPYGSTKAAMINLAESLRAEEGNMLDIKVINPGFVKTRLTDKNDFDMPMRITPEKAAIYIAKGLEKSGFDIHFPKRFTLIVKTLTFLPSWLYFKIVGR